MGLITPATPISAAYRLYRKGRITQEEFAAYLAARATNDQEEAA